ncbi:Nrap domain containing protein [Trichuris trichiura]|uniref:Nucleolar protein 6 n=1 Tax=Trichuris trichiura TaxID=36087 RepID=A0A077ZIT1_TRITR|nr:Nrap domain containing protein [Trichuris trichiura]
MSRSVPETLFSETDEYELQAQALLSSIRKDAETQDVLKNYVAALKSMILETTQKSFATEIYDNLSLIVKAANRFKLQAYVLGLQRLVSGRFHFILLPPVAIHIVGSYPLGLCIDSVASIDLALEMPTGMFDKGDASSYAYHLKTSFVLLAVADRVRSSALVKQISITYRHDDPRKLTMVIVPPDPLQNCCQVNLFAFASPNTFPLRRFAPSVIHLSKDKFEEARNLNLKALPSPLYNQSILRDLTLLSTRDYLLLLPEKCICVVLLLRAWLRCRQLDRGCGGLSCTFASMFVSHLLKGKQLREGDTVWSNFKAVLSAIVHLNMKVTPISIGPKEGDVSNVSIASFQENFELVFIDPTGFVNICSDCTETIWKQVQHEASLSLQAISEEQPDLTFIGLFQQQLPFAEKFDICFTLNARDCLRKFACTSVQTCSRYIDSAYMVYESSWSKIQSTLFQAFGDRILLIGKTLIDFSKVNPKDDSVFPEPSPLVFGLLMESNSQTDRLIRGPRTEEPQAAKFREFWGELSQLRKFQGHGTCEAVLFDEDQRTTVTVKIVEYIMQRHFSIPKEAIRSNDSLIVYPPKNAFRKKPKAAAQAKEQTFKDTFDHLEKKLNLLSELPFNIIDVAKLSPAFYDCEINSPVASQDSQKFVDIVFDCAVPKWNAGQLPPWRQSLEVLASINLNAKHLKDISELRRLKQAVCLIISDGLKKLKCVTKPFGCDLLILEGGYVFRLLIRCAGEESVYESLPDGSKLTVDMNTSRVSHARHMTSLCNHFEALASTIRTAKQWISCRMLSDYLKDEAVELIVLSLFLCPFPYTSPRHHFSGFLRFLRLLATYDWTFNPLVVNIGGQLKNDDIAEIKREFRNLRPSLPPFCLVTPENRLGNRWTQQQPCASVADWICRLARNAIDQLEKPAVLTTTYWKNRANSFAPPLRHFNAIIQLAEGKVTCRQRPQEAIDVPHTPLAMPVIDFNSVSLYLRDLRETYGQLALFFYNHWQGTSIGVIWKPSFISMLRKNNADNKTLSEAANEIIKGFYHLGAELVQKIIVQEDAKSKETNE